MSVFVLTPKEGWLRLNTWKEGLLSRIGHDLLLDIRDFSIRVEGQPSAWKVQTVIKKNSFYVLEPASLSGREQEEIHQNISKHLPDDISFRGDVEQQGEHRLVVRGFLSLGRNQTPIHFDLDWQASRVTGRVVLSHEALQLKPYRAPLGLIRLQDRVELTLSLDVKKEVV